MYVNKDWLNTIRFYNKMYKEIMPGIPEYLSSIQSVLSTVRDNRQMLSTMQETLKIYSESVAENYNYNTGEAIKSMSKSLSLIKDASTITPMSIGLTSDLILRQKEAVELARKMTSTIDTSAILGISAVLKSMPSDYTAYIKAFSKILSQYADLSNGQEYDFEDDTIEIEEDGSISIDGEVFTSEEIPEIIDRQAKEINEGELTFVKTIADLKKRFRIFIVIMNAVMTLSSVYECFDLCKEITQKVIADYNGWENLYYIGNESGAAVYQEPSTSSTVLLRIDYSNIVLKIEDAKMWVKVQCTDSQDNETEGWIAKRNLIPYADVQFDSDEAVCIP